MGVLRIVITVSSGRSLVKIAPVMAEIEKHPQISAIHLHIGYEFETPVPEGYLRSEPTKLPCVFPRRQAG